MALQNVTGKIKKCGAFPLKKPISNPFDSDGPDFTHRLAIQMDDDNWYGFGNTDKDHFLVKDAETNKWEILGPGSEVLIQYTLSDCGKYRNAKKSNLTVLNLVPGKRYEGGGNNNSSGGNTNASSSGGGYDLSGVKVGHALNGAMLLSNNGLKSPAEILNLAKQVHGVSVKVEADYRKLDTGNSSPGAAAGNAVLNACKITDDISKVEGIAKQLLVKVVPVLTDYVKGKGEASQQESQKETQAAPQEEEPKQEQPAKEEEPKVETKPVHPNDMNEPETTDDNIDFDGFGDMDDGNFDF